VLFRSQWNDDYHHAWHVLLTGETSGYYIDYRNPQRHLARTLSSGFSYQGEISEHRGGVRRGEPSSELPPMAFVNFLQNHDQVGNRPRGDRLSVLTAGAPLEAALAVTLLSPMPPMMFMGEEWDAREPFPFFCDFRDELAEAIRAGRKAEFVESYTNTVGGIPDPLVKETFYSAKLDWSARSVLEHRRRLDLVCRLLALRKATIVPLIEDLQVGHARARSDRGLLFARWQLRTELLVLVANLSEGELPRPTDGPVTVPIWGGLPPTTLPPWSVYWGLGRP